MTTPAAHKPSPATTAPKDRELLRDIAVFVLTTFKFTAVTIKVTANIIRLIAEGFETGMNHAISELKNG